jgi:hypothetical protein
MRTCAVDGDRWSAVKHQLVIHRLLVLLHSIPRIPFLGLQLVLGRHLASSAGAMHRTRGAAARTSILGVAAGRGHFSLPLLSHGTFGTVE